MPLEELTKQDHGVVGISQAIGVDVAIISNPGPGRWKIWGNGRHSLADGLRLVVGSTIITEIASAAASSTTFGPVVVDILNSTDDIIVELNLATGGADSASATVYAQRLSG